MSTVSGVTKHKMSTSERLSGPQIWLQGDPEDLRDMMPLGIAGLVTNNLILRGMAQKYTNLNSLLARYLELDPNALVVEVDGDTYEEFLYAAEVASDLSDKVIVKVVTKPVGIRVLATLRSRGIRTMATTVFSLNQAIMMAAAGADWIAPFVGPTHGGGNDAFALVQQISETFKGRPRMPGIMGGIIRDPSHAQIAYAAGADAIVTFPNVYWDMLKHAGTDEWNTTFRHAWADMEDRGQLDGYIPAD